MRSSTPSKRSTSSPQRQASEATGQPFLESGSGNFLGAAAGSSSSNSNSNSRRFDEASGSTSRKSSLEHFQQKRLSSLVRNSNDFGENLDRKHQQHQRRPQGLEVEEESERLLEEQDRRNLAWTQFANDSLISQTSEAPGQYQPQQQQQQQQHEQSTWRPSPRSVSLNSLKENFSCFHHHHQQQQHHHHHHHQPYNQNNLRQSQRQPREFDFCASHSHESQRLMSGKYCFCRTEVTNSDSGAHCNSRHCCCQSNNKDLDASRHSSSASADEMGTSAQSSQLIPAYFMAELIGTFLLVIIGDGSVGAYVLTRREVDTFCTCLAFGVGAMIASFACGKISGAHLNPAATLAFALDGQLKWILVPVYLVAQYLGGFLAALVLFLNYSEAIDSLDGGQHTAFGSSNSTGGIFATYPAPYVTVWGSLLDQIVGTAVLLFSICAVCDTKNRALDVRQQPIVIALVIGLVCVAFSPNCGAIFNPARDLSPRLLTALFGYSSVWEPIEGTYWILAGVVGPHMGAIIGVFAYKYLIGNALKAFDRHAQKASAAAASATIATYNQVCSEKPSQQQHQQLPCVQHYQLEPRHHEPNDYGAAR